MSGHLRDKVRRYPRSQALHEISQIILESLELRGMMADILKTTVKIGAFDLGLIAMLDGVANCLLPIADFGFRDAGNVTRHAQRLQQKINIGVIEDVVERREIRVVDLSSEKKFETLRQEGVESLCVVPLRAGDVSIGVIYLGSRGRRSFAASELQLFASIGTQAGIAAQKSRLFEALSKKTQQLEALAEINRHLASSLDTEILLPRIAEEARLLLHADGANFRLVDGDKLMLVSASDPQSLPFRLSLGISESLPGRVYQEQQLVIVRDVKQDSRMIEEHRHLIQNAQYSSYIGIPLRFGDAVIGVLSCYSRTPRDISSDEICLVNAFADQAAIAVHNARLYEQAHNAQIALAKSNLRLEQTLRQQNNLFAALAPLAPEDSMNRVMEKVIDRILDLVGSEAALVRLRDKTTGGFYYVAQKGFPAQFLTPMRSVAPESTLGRIFASGEPLISENTATDARFSSRAQALAGLYSCAFLPLKVGQNVRGVVHLASREHGYFSEDQRDNLMAIVGQMGIAIRNRELFDEVNDAKIELERSNADLEQFAYVASHDLQEPLRMISSYTQILAKRYQGKLDGEADEFIGYVVEGAKRMQVLIRDLLTYSRVNTRNLDMEYCDGEMVFAAALKNLRSIIDENAAVVTHDPLPQWYGNAVQVALVLQHLISNGVKFKSSRRPEIHVSCRVDGQRWLIGVHDNGIGIDRQFWQRIFIIFQRLHTRQEYSGTGIGLALCKKVIERHNGRIWVDSEAGKGSTFYFTLPRFAEPESQDSTPA